VPCDDSVRARVQVPSPPLQSAATARALPLPRAAAAAAHGSVTAERFVPSLDGLRAISIALVVVSHLGYEHVIPGGFGVTLFFFISGLLITDQLTAQIRRTGKIHVGHFYARRFLRLAPAGVAYIVAGGLLYVAMGGVISAAEWLTALLYGGNYYDLFVKYDSTGLGFRHPFTILWSLAVEEHYYLMWPLALLALRPGRRAVAAIAALCALSLVWRAGVYHACFGHDPVALCGLRVEDRLYKATDARLDSLGFGVLVALLVDADARWSAWLGRQRLLQVLAVCVLLSTFLIRDPWFRQVPRYTLQGLALMVLVPAVIVADSPVRRALETPLALWLGRLSYSLYLWHWGAMMIAEYLLHDERSPAYKATALFLMGALAAASYYGVERPMLRLRRRFGSHAVR
jgi:peptidoglycan/LPS O-acetylase OafA/YrhL